MVSLRALLNLASELVGPSRCAACDEPTGPNVLFCVGCAATVVRCPEDEAAFEYGGALASAIQRLKYGGRPDLGPALGRVMLATAGRRSPIDLVVPVPLHPRRLVERGYNQSALLAGPIAELLGAPLLPRALVRLRDTEQQVRLERGTRLLNVAQAFAARMTDRLCGARVLLVDDVRTTGATLAACTMTLEAAGARDVVAVVLARKA